MNCWKRTRYAADGQSITGFPAIRQKLTVAGVRDAFDGVAVNVAFKLHARTNRNRMSRFQTWLSQRGVLRTSVSLLCVLVETTPHSRRRRFDRALLRLYHRSGCRPGFDTLPEIWNKNGTKTVQTRMKEPPMPVKTLAVLKMSRKQRIPGGRRTQATSGGDWPVRVVN